jgi:ornithine cyclodeaminase/alanine dehydrogenase-like protein (mu-crystallin family)
LPDALFSLIDYVFIDTEHGMSESGDLIDPVKKGLLPYGRFINLNDLITGKILPQRATRLLKSVGMAVFDLYAAILVYESQSLNFKL